MKRFEELRDEFDPEVHYHVIEKSAYDRLEACCEKLAETLEFLIEEGQLVHSNALEEYRAMRDQTKMPCPRND